MATMQVGGVILCGGESRRMGRSKAALPFGSETVLSRILRTVMEVAQPVVLVRRPNQELPPLSSFNLAQLAAVDSPQKQTNQLTVTEDIYIGKGPLAGIHAGLTCLQSQVSHAIVVSCDVPLVRAQFLRRLIFLLQHAERHRPPHAPPFLACVPILQEQRHPLVAVYAVAVLPLVEQSLQAGQLRPLALLEQVPVRWVEPSEWVDIDPDSLSLFNINTPADYNLALRYAT